MLRLTHHFGACNVQRSLISASLTLTLQLEDNSSDKSTTRVANHGFRLPSERRRTLSVFCLCFFCSFCSLCSSFGTWLIRLLRRQISIASTNTNYFHDPPVSMWNRNKSSEGRLRRRDGDFASLITFFDMRQRKPLPYDRVYITEHFLELSSTSFWTITAQHHSSSNYLFSSHLFTTSPSHHSPTLLLINLNWY